MRHISAFGARVFAWVIDIGIEWQERLDNAGEKFSRQVRVTEKIAGPGPPIIFSRGA